MTAALLVALATGHPELVALAAPFVLALLRRSPPVPAAAEVGVEVVPASYRVVQGDEIALTARVSPVPGAWGLVEVGFSAHGVVALGPTDWALAADGGHHELRVRADRIGSRDVGRVRIGVLDALLLYRAEVTDRPAGMLRVVPRPAEVVAREAVPSALGFTGGHRSADVGPGVEFAGVRPFSVGDRPRRMNWRTTVRTGIPHVNTTTTEHSARVCVLVDSTPSGDTGRILVDVTVRAALGVARSYLRLGDAVAMVEFGARDRLLRSSSGRAHLPFVQDWLADVRPKINTVAFPTRPTLPPGSGRDVVLAVTPLVDASTAEGLVRLRQQGILVGVLAALPPEGLRLGDLDDPVEEIATRLWALDRDRIIHQLGQLGVPVATWDGTGDLDLALRRLTRAARAPRLALR